MRSALFIFGICLMGLGFVAGAAEIAAQGVRGELRAIMGMGEVWQVLSPDSLEEMREWGVALLGENWQAVEIVMLVPGWAVFGLPGFVLSMAFRERNLEMDAEHEDSVMLYDELAKQAREEEFHRPEQGDDIMNPAPEHIVPADESMAREDDPAITENDTPGDGPEPKTPEQG